ncbi:hypothetical protein BU24DRAFT_496810 [Aaosphaeria arxii CBS 175.79]|uniref:Pre-mRNA polyadenylation factor Fip1 domain-containing protein n=1 Tax=Aaosphaeria arxii CBS 175.79 TaxID=1450172 RepID=A0A6A5XAK5_9PLEO|nr:uncharacterized protein BU24DRAFT_496810 [Aaosphaeria arxii CBS 175.79]KAF2009992.1 hypothetical protein BU24DRAFT_496810 [Aaosphaeria arxii CBS 175.79]
MPVSEERSASRRVVEARREAEMKKIKEKLDSGESVVTAVCRLERVSADSQTIRYGLKRGKLVYLFKYPNHDVEGDKQRNIIKRARFIQKGLEEAGYHLIPWDFKKGKPPTFWEEEGTMEEEDDDLYGPSESSAAVDAKKDVSREEEDGEQGDESMDEGEESGEESDESDSDLEIIIDKPQTAPKPISQAPQESKAIKIEAPQQPSSTPTAKSASAVPQIPSQPGTAYPAVRTSTIDVNADPIYPPAGKPVSQLDMDADLAESTKPWRLPGADQSDYFNYGFDEFTWEMYRQRQTDMSNNLSRQKAETAQFQQMFMGGPSPAPGAGNAGPGPMPGAPTGPSAQNSGGGGMPPMPPGMGMNEEQMMQTMMQMQASGMDVGNMDISQFMQMVGGGMPGMGGGGGGGFGGQQQGNQGGGGRGQGRRGRGW